MRKLEFQDRVLSTLEDYVDALAKRKQEANDARKVAAEYPHLNLQVPDFAERAWEDMRAQGRLPHSRADVPFSPRHDGVHRSVPNALFKVPTGGGKTWLAVNSVSRIMSRYLQANVGFVLWIVPNEAIYRQTLRNLRDRQHPYRQALDRAAAGNVKVLEKHETLAADDIKNNLCVMLLMLQAANRESQESLKMFQDRGDVHGFFPPEGEQQLHKSLIDQVPNLQAYNDIFPLVKDSLGNALRLTQPVVVMDEGHKAVAELAFRTLYDFNPCFVLELTATPRDVRTPRSGGSYTTRYANVLVEVSGRELDNEGMIKMPLNLDTRQNPDWRATLGVAFTKLGEVAEEARVYRAEAGRYIRPILLVQVERTGNDQRESGKVHALDVKEQLQTLGLDESEIAIKTAETNDLAQPENHDLLSPTNRIRVIITKQALQEGWDCPFAYILCSLAASSNKKAMTQLVGRILRQPNAAKTGYPKLDECFVITHYAETTRVVKAIKEGLERDGLGDAYLNIEGSAGSTDTSAMRKLPRRPEFASNRIFLPKVMFVSGTDTRELDYETDILAGIDWRDFDASPVVDAVPDNAQVAVSQMQRFRLADDGETVLVGDAPTPTAEMAEFDTVHAVRMMSDIVLNPFVARDIVEHVVGGLRDRGFTDRKMASLTNVIIDILRRKLDAERLSRAETIFKRGIDEGWIQFRLRVDGFNWRMPYEVETQQPANARHLQRDDGSPIEKSLFRPMFEKDLNSEERKVAYYLDSEGTVSWWHRNVARSHYGLQGWQRQRVYPDFVFYVRKGSDDRRIVVLETKGAHLDNLDTEYKRRLLETLSESFCWDSTKGTGELEIVRDDGETVQCALVLLDDWAEKLPAYL